MAALMAGVAVKAITPSKPVYLAGLARNRLSRGVHDDIYVRAVMLSDGRTIVGIASLDLIGLSRGFVLETMEELRGMGIDAERIIIACTHQHSGPDTIGLWGPEEGKRGVDLEYMSFLKGKIVEAISEAREGMRPAQMKLGSALLPERGVSRNVREPDLIDRELTLMILEGKGGEPICSLINFTAHPETLWSDNLLLTSDYVGYLRRRVEGVLGGTAIFLNGALGGMVTVDAESNSFEEAERIGFAAAETALEAARLAEPRCPDLLPEIDREDTARKRAVKAGG